MTPTNDRIVEGEIITESTAVKKTPFYLRKKYVVTVAATAVVGAVAFVAYKKGAFLLLDDVSELALVEGVTDVITSE